MANSQSAAQRASAQVAVGRMDRGGFVYHKPHGQPYAFGCNRQTIRDANKKHACIGIDLDINPNKQGTPFVHHMLHPTKGDAWFDPKHQINDHDLCRNLTDAQMHRLKVHYKGANRPILSALQAAQACQANGNLLPCFEAKFQTRLYLDPQWWYDQFIDGWAPTLQPVIMALPGTGGGQAGLKKLAAAHEAGLPTVWLWRGNTPITRTQGFKNAVDLVKSRPGHGIYKV